jgi:hypothetical protein
MCKRAGWLLAFLPAEGAKITSGEAELTDYQFGKKHIHDTFCRTCGVRAFSRGKDEQGHDTWPVNMRGLAGLDPTMLPVEVFDRASLGDREDRSRIRGRAYGRKREVAPMPRFPRSARLAVLVLVSECLIAACGNRSSGAGGSTSTSTHTNASTSSSGGGEKSSTGSTNTSTSASTSTSSGSGGDAGSDGGTNVVATVNLGDVPQQILLDTAHTTVYVSLQGGGIAVVDTTNDTLTTTIPNPAVDAGGNPTQLFWLAVDPVANVLYAANLYSSVVWVFSGSTHALTTSFDVSPGSGAGIGSLAVDPSAHTLYAELFTQPGAAPSVAAIDTTSNAVSSTLVLSDIGASSAAKGTLALDTTNHLLFVCGMNTATFEAAADAIDTTTKAEVGAPQVLTGIDNSYVLGCSGNPGSAVMMTTSVNSASAVLRSLEPVSVQLPAAFTPDSYLMVEMPPRTVLVFGHTPTNAQEFVLVGLPPSEDGGVSVSSATPFGVDNTNTLTHIADGTSNMSGMFDVYTAVDVPTPDGGGTPPQRKILYHVRIQ